MAKKKEKQPPWPLAKPNGKAESKSDSKAEAKPASNKKPGRAVGVLTDSDLALAKEDALLQLKIGRNAHFISIGVFVALLIDGFLFSTFAPQVQPFVPPFFRGTLFLVFPIGSAVYLSVFGLVVKWDEFTLGRWESHFALTVLSVPFSVLIAALYLASLFQVGPTGNWPLVPWFLPLALLGLSMPMTALAQTWSEWSSPKTFAVATALLPLVFALGLYLPIGGGSTAAGALGLTLIVSGALYQTSGSFLHLISSGTEATERAVITSGQSRVYALAEELQRKDDALQFRESTLVKREADVEDAEGGLARRHEAFEAARKDFEAQAAEVRGQSSGLADQERKVTLARAEVDAQKRALEDRESALKVKESDAAQHKQRLSSKEDALNAQEAAIGKRAGETEAKARAVADREQASGDAEARAQTRLREVETKTADLLRREADLRAREVAHGPSSKAAGGSASAQERTRLAAQTQDLATRNTELLHRQAKLEQLDKTLAQRAREVESLREQLRTGESTHADKERTLQLREQKVKQREEEIRQMADSATTRQSQYTEVVRKYEERAKALANEQADVATKASEVRRVAVAVGGREKAVAEHEARLAAERADFDKKQRDFTQREHAFAAKESELALRRQELETRPPVALTAAAGGLLASSDDRTKALDIREKQLREKESELARRAYELAHPPAQEADTLVAAPTKRIADRAPTGIGRLDDLLLGGMPPKGHLMLVGPPFVGKEVALYAFIAEGLKRGEGAILVTTSKTPQEVAHEVGIIAPQFREYEHMGRVAWIDASNPAATPSMTEKPAVHAVVKGPGDYEGILKALVKATQKREGPDGSALRVGVVALSACLAQGEEKSGFGFLQNFVGILKPRGALGMYLVDRGTINDAQVETVQARMEGAIVFRTERGKNFLSVQGLGEVATRDWVEYRATNRSLIIGSFSLERIR